MDNYLEKFLSVRQKTVEICDPLQTEDYVVQPIVDVSPPKWHLGHTTWFFETFLLKPLLKPYREFDPSYNFVFNSYYETVGARVIRTDRGNLSRPAVSDVYNYREHVDEAMQSLLSSVEQNQWLELLELGLNHEQQHQELLYTDIKYILGNNPLFPAYGDTFNESLLQGGNGIIKIPEGVYQIGYDGNDFCFDNERKRHSVYLHEYAIAGSLVTNAEYLEFIDAGGYQDFQYWHAEGWDWVKVNHVNSPMYWHLIDENWHNYTMKGLKSLELSQPVTHISYYEACAFAQWKGMRLPTEAEWEVAAVQFNWGNRWEWTGSAYLPYPGYSRAEGAIGEYNGKFMVNQMVLRGASCATAEGHSRITYRNFFHPQLQWQYTGIRLAQ